MKRALLPLEHMQMHRSRPLKLPNLPSYRFSLRAHFPEKRKEIAVTFHNSQLAQWKLMWSQWWKQNQDQGSMEGHYQRMKTYIRTQVTYTGLCHSLGMACYNYLKTEGSCQPSYFLHVRWGVCFFWISNLHRLRSSNQGSSKFLAKKEISLKDYKVFSVDIRELQIYFIPHHS